MKAFVLVVVLLTSSECLAQATATQTFEQLGKRLEEAQQALTSPSSPGRTNRGQRNEARRASNGGVRGPRTPAEPIAACGFPRPVTSLQTRRANSKRSPRTRTPAARCSFSIPTASGEGHLAELPLNRES